MTTKSHLTTTRDTTSDFRTNETTQNTNFRSAKSGTKTGFGRSHMTGTALSIKYGELILLGFNGSLHEKEKGRRRSKYALNRRATANGIRKSRHMSVADVASSAPMRDTTQHSIAYTLSRNQTIVVLYERDPETDMFQVGRSREPQIDFVVMDTTPDDITQDTLSGETRSGISRYACRFLADRDTDEHDVRVFAAGFDASSNIFLGENATQWQGAGGSIDGLTTNGVLVMHPSGVFTEEASAGTWREVSIDGGIYGLRESRAARKAGKRITAESNVLVDGSLIDLCGATLLFRSAEGLQSSPTHSELVESVTKLNAGRPQCPVGLNTLVLSAKPTMGVTGQSITGRSDIGRSARTGGRTAMETAMSTNMNTGNAQQQPYVYLRCGHVQGLHSWGTQVGNEKKCPMCMKSGPVAMLEMGMEPAFYVDRGAPNFAFNPCGHMASERTVKYWASVPTPHGQSGLNAICPFCATQLVKKQEYVRLIFQDNID